MTTMARVLALDPATKTGWALADNGRVTASGVWDLAPTKQRRFEGGGMRFVRLRRHLEEVGKVDLLVLEEVRRHAGVDAAHAYGGALAVITAWCEEHGIPYESIPVGTIKRHATGKGNADKRAMIEAARLRGWDPEDDNEADALWLLDLVTQRAAA